MSLRWQFVAGLLLQAPHAFGQPARATQDVRVTPYATRFLRFSRDSSLLRVIGESSGDTSQSEHVRAVTYAVGTGAVVHVVNLQPDTMVLSATSDGSRATVATNTSGSNGHLFLLDTATGQLQPIPDSWYSPDSDMEADLSGDGRLISTYTETETDTPMTVSVYDWRTKTLIATRRSGLVSAGGAMGGGITEDGEVEFSGNRVGSTIVDLKTGRVLAHFGPSAVRSPDGKWEVQFPNRSWDEDAPSDVLLRDGRSGATIGKLDAHIPELGQNGAFTGVFCGTSGRLIMFGDRTVAAYLLPSGKLLQTIPGQTWKDPTSDDAYAVSVACSSDGTRVAILDGTHLTFHHLPAVNIPAAKTNSAAPK